jgi:hypothetical protein
MFRHVAFIKGTFGRIATNQPYQFTAWVSSTQFVCDGHKATLAEDRLENCIRNLNVALIGKKDFQFMKPKFERRQNFVIVPLARKDDETGCACSRNSNLNDF